MVDIKQIIFAEVVEVLYKIAFNKEEAPAGLNFCKPLDTFNKLKMAYPAKPNNAAVVGVLAITLAKIANAV